MHRSHHRLAGLLLPAFSPRRAGDLGIGDTLALRDWIDWAADSGIGFLQLLPIHENGPEESPYSAISSAALDPIYLSMDVGEIPSLTPADLAAARSSMGHAADARSVDYPAVRRTKRALLEIAWARFASADPALHQELAAFEKNEAPWLNDYCLFRYLMEIHGESLTWDQWPDDCRTPQGARDYVASLQSENPDLVARRLGYFSFVQWLCFRQWKALRSHADFRNVKLMGDVPIGISFHSCDVFFEREEFHLDWSGGSPEEGMSQSDPFFQQWGQNWGIPLYRWNHMAEDGFAWWRRRIKRLTTVFNMFRLDHILGFYRIYAFPWRPDRNHEFLGLSREQAAERTDGRLPRWCERPDDTPDNKAANRADGDTRLRAITSAAGKADIIAEDLGWVPEYVRPHLADLGIACFRIPHWDCDHDGQPTPGDHFPENSFATYSTHDHDPINGVWRGCLDVIRQHHENPTEQTGWWIAGAHNTLRVLSQFAEIPIPTHGPWPPFTEGIRLRLIKALFASNSRFATLMVTELFGLDDRINRPGTTDAANWSFRLPWTLEDIRNDSQLGSTGKKLLSIISITHRTPLPK